MSVVTGDSGSPSAVSSASRAAERIAERRRNGLRIGRDADLMGVSREMEALRPLADNRV